MKALLLRVAIDTGSGGNLAPILPDGRFEYIPIPELKPTLETRTYGEMAARTGGALADFLSATLRNRVPHIDPEFLSFTYGDPTASKRRQLLRLEPDDLLVFYAGLKPNDGRDVPRPYIIGYFDVRRIYDFERMTTRERTAACVEIGENAHLKRVTSDKGLVVVQGHANTSRLLHRALPLGDPGYRVLPDLTSRIGLSGSVLRAIGRWVEGEAHFGSLRNWLDHGPVSLIDEDSRLFSYVVAHDTGFAPNVKGGYCTLACCKPRIRGAARRGDLVLGTASSRYGRNRISFLMRVSEVLSFEDYFNDPRFAAKKPDNDPDGDNIYFRAKGRFRQLSNRHHRNSDLAHDTQVDKVLVGSLFWYFGDSAPELPRRFADSIIKKGPGHRTIRGASTVGDLVNWVCARYRNGVLAIPRDSMKSPQLGRRDYCS